MACKLNKNFKNKSVSILTKFSQVLNGSPMITGIFVDSDDNFIYLTPESEEDGVIAVPKLDIQMVIFGTVEEVSEINLPSGSKMQ